MTEKDLELAKKLLDRYRDGSATEEELQRVDAWFNEYAEQLPHAENEENLEEVGREIWAKLPVHHQGVRRLWSKVAATAAAVVLIIGIGFWNYNSSNTVNHSKVATTKISPGGYGATLTLSNGKKIKLGQLSNGELVKEAGVAITKTADGQLVYEVIGNPATGSHLNTLSTSAGEMFRVNLPDGSSVWLNAMSSLAYQTDLATANIRKVTLKGEGFFEVAKNPHHPFIVQTARQEIKVLGTAFNVSSYTNDETETTTLIHGSVAMRTATDQTVLKPGEQGVIKSGKINTSTANIYSAMGWKNNEFVFASQDIKAIMKLIARWYNVEIEYQGNISTDKISGSISRFADIHSALEIIEATGTVKIRVEDRKIIISEFRK